MISRLSTLHAGQRAPLQPSHLLEIDAIFRALRYRRRKITHSQELRSLYTDTLPRMECFGLFRPT